MAKKKKIAAVVATAATAGAIILGTIGGAETPKETVTETPEKQISKEKCEAKNNMVWIEGFGIQGCFTKKK